MRVNDEFEAREVTVVRLFRNGEPIIDHHGQPVDYASFDDALHVAANWDQFRAPSCLQLKAMSDEELQRRLDP